MNHEVDAAILVATPIHGGFVKLPILRSEFAWVASSGTLADRSRFDLTTLSACKVAPYDFGIGFTALFDEIKHLGNGHDLGVVGPLAAARRLVRDHGYVGFLPLEAVREELTAGVLIELTVTGSPRVIWEVVIAYRRRTPESAQINRLEHVVRRLWPTEKTD